MSEEEYIEKDINDKDSILEYLNKIEEQTAEMILTSAGKTVGAILTSAQYEWFLDQIDEQQNIDFVEERLGDKEGSQSLDDLKKELGQ